MRRRSTVTKKMTVLLLSAVLISMMTPGYVLAQERSTEGSAEISIQSGTENTESDADSANTDDAGADSGQGQDDAGADNGQEQDNAGADNGQEQDNADADGGQEQNNVDADNEPDQQDDQQKGGQQTASGQDGTWTEEMPEVTPDPIAFPILLESTNGLYNSLSEFLSLSSDQFQIYTVAIIDPMTRQQVQPDSPVEVALDVPSGYDTDRVVVSEISMDGETPVRTELSFTYNNGKAVFETDHSGIYVVMEKKVQPQLPASLEMTSKVEKLELIKKYPSSISLTASARSLAVNPQTGDDNSVLIWGVVTVIAAAAVIALVVLFIRRRK